MAGLLLPALSRARKAARASQCLSNLKQVGLAFLMYAGEQEDWIATDIVTPVDIPWSSKLYAGGYMTALDAMVCPSWEPGRWTDHSDAFSNDKWYTYATRKDQYSEGATGNWGTDSFLNLAAVRSPSRVFITTDSIKITTAPALVANAKQYYKLRPADPGGEGAAHRRHANRANQLFADGHVEAVGQADLLARRILSVDEGNTALQSVTYAATLPDGY